MSSYVTGGEYLTPVRIHADRPGGRLEIEWADGHRTEYDTVTLRWLCPCAYCRGEAGMPGWLDSAPVLTPEQTQIVDIQLVGQYAVCPSWADGHHTASIGRESTPTRETSTSRKASDPTMRPMNRMKSADIWGLPFVAALASYQLAMSKAW